MKRFSKTSLAAFLMLGLSIVGAAEAQLLPGAVHVDAYGATPNDGLDDTVAIQNAINSIAVNQGGVVYFSRGRYDISQTLDVAYRGVILRGTGPTGGIWTNGEARGTSLIWRGVWTPRGMIHMRYGSGAGVENLRLHGNGVASWGLRLTGIKAGLFKDVTVEAPATGGIRLDTHYEDDPALNWMGGKANKFEQIYIDLVSNGYVSPEGAVTIPRATIQGLVGILFMGKPEAGLRTDWHGNMFSVGVIKFSKAANHTGLDLKFTDSNTFYEFDVQNDGGPGGTGKGLIFDSVDHGFPLNNAFYNSSIGGGVVVQNNSYSVGKNFFLPFPTKDGETLPPAPLRGIDDEWRSINGALGNVP